MKKLILHIGKIIVLIGINPKKIFYSLIGIPKFLKDATWFFKNRRNLANQNFRLSFFPVLGENLNNSASLDKAYFFQDQWAARRVYDKNPTNHADIGSRIDGFVGNLLTFRKVKVFDIRPLDCKIHNLEFIEKDFMKSAEHYYNSFDSVSCLHALEHFGLGRYGDSLDINGWKYGLKNLALLIKSEGNLYLSVPIGKQRIEFNAHRIFNTSTIISEAKKHKLMLEHFSFIDDAGVYHSNYSLDDANNANYGCGCFEFTKLIG